MCSLHFHINMFACFSFCSKNLGSRCSPQQTLVGKTCCSVTLQPNSSKPEMKTLWNGWDGTITSWKLWTAHSQVWIFPPSSHKSFYFYSFTTCLNLFFCNVCVCVFMYNRRCPFSTAMVCPVSWRAAKMCRHGCGFQKQKFDS